MRTWPRELRWLVAELIPFGFIFVAMVLTLVGAALVGFILGAFIGIPLTLVYLNWVQDAHSAWILPLIGLMFPAIYTGMLIFGHTISKGEPLVVTPAYWQAFGGLLAALAVTVALAVVNGERHHGRYSYVVRR